MSKYAVIDVANLFYRVRHVVSGDAYTKAGMTLHIIFNSLRKLHREFKVDHMVFCVEGHSWRYKVYPQYKSKRKLDRAKQTLSASEQEEEVFFSIMNDFVNHLAEKTRCTVLQSNGVEGDDFVARWIQLHPNDEHVVLSGDSDFIQLLSDNVSIFNGVDNRLLTTKGAFDEDGKELVFSIKSDSGKLRFSTTVEAARVAHEKEQKAKEKEHNASERARAALFEKHEKTKTLDSPDYKPQVYIPTTYEWKEFDFTPEPEWWRKALFVKIIRGDTGDSIQSSYPGVRYTVKSKVGICEAWEDRHEKLFQWNNFMMHEWDKIVGFEDDGSPKVKTVKVIDEFQFNESLIDLTKQPEDVKNLMDTVIVQAVQKEPVGNVGIHFLKFCKQYDLPRLSKDAQEHAAYLNAPYQR